jgi:hypothetical protein
MGAIPLALIIGGLSELILFGLGLLFGHVGPCGPSNYFGALVFWMLFPPFLVGLGLGLSFLALIVIVVIRRHPRPAVAAPR